MQQNGALSYLGYPALKLHPPNKSRTSQHSKKIQTDKNSTRKISQRETSITQSRRNITKYVIIILGISIAL